ncbi:hypothetical protein ACFLTA_02445 [Bacteroidota bacterium]
MDTFDKFRNEVLVRKEKEFNAAVQRIEEKCIDFFKSRESIRSEYDEHDRLHNHFILGSNFANDPGFGICDDSDLPEHIKVEVTNAFHRIFGSEK